MRSRIIRRWIGRIRHWPLHPQWLIAASVERRDLHTALAQLQGRVLDIGCSDRRLSRQLPADCSYIGLDYLDTAVGMYGTRPDVFADATTLPFKTGCMDAVILKDVLEHVGGPYKALSEISRVMRDGGKLMLWMPFIYPIHDAPYDFQRFTEHGLRRYLSECGFDITEFVPVLKPAETASLMLCLALADMAEQILLRRRWLLPLLPVLALFVLLTNLTGKVLGLFPATQFMPAFYRVMAVRTQRSLAEGSP